MSKLAFIFPGQGAQYIGMGKDFYDGCSAGREVFEEASEVTGLDIAGLCFEENDKLNVTEYTQIAMTAVEISILKAVQEKGLKPSVCGGLSLGEYSALAASGVMTTADIFRVVRQRGKFMQEAVPSGGAMAAVLGMESPKISGICEETDGIVSIANYNCPGQIVITGEEKAVRAASDRLKEAGAKKVIPLNVSGPFHSEMLKGAGDKLAEVLKDVDVKDPEVPYTANVTAEYIESAGQVKDLLARQVSSSVKWEQCIRKMMEHGVDTFVEIGPGKTLTGFMKKISRDVRAVNIEKFEDLEKCGDLFD